ncbi:MAG: hypothetical protein FWD83_08625 [Promicromonosporaceae bacterium]|nr:hypothetical protein [Promicromonosporaceae bacterium]
MSKYTVEVERGNLRWSMQAVEAPGAISEVDNLDDAELYMREAISYVTGEPEESIKIELVPILPETVRERLRHSRQLRDEATRANSKAAAEYRTAVRDLKSIGISTRDIGILLGVSKQRVAQLMAA